MDDMDAMLITSRLLLRPPRPGDAPALYAIQRDPEAMRHTWCAPSLQACAQRLQAVTRRL